MLRLDGAGGYSVDSVDDMQLAGSSESEGAGTVVTRDGASVAADSKGVPARMSVMSTNTARTTRSFGVEGAGPGVREVAGGFGLTADGGEGANMKFDYAFWRRLVKLLRLGFPSWVSYTLTLQVGCHRLRGVLIEGGVAPHCRPRSASQLVSPSGSPLSWPPPPSCKCAWPSCPAPSTRYVRVARARAAGTASLTAPSLVVATGV